MKNRLIDLNNHLFAQLERLSDEDLGGEKLSEELQKTKAITSVANNIISNARLALDAKVAIQENMIKHPPLMLGAEGYDDKE
jgi:hypothetical protein